MTRPGDQIPRFLAGDHVAHATRPEWGTGTVKQALGIDHEGTPAQRLVVDFPNKGRVTLNTAIAPLRAAAPPSTHPVEPSAHGQGNKMTRTPTVSSASGGGWLAELESRASGQGPIHELWELPEELSDPFQAEDQRLAHTLGTYKYSTEPRSLMDWAIRQTGLDDPMTKYNRTEMEQAFGRFARDRDLHLKELIRQMKRNGQHPVIQAARRNCKIPAALSALDKAMRA